MIWCDSCPPLKTETELSFFCRPRDEIMTIIPNVVFNESFCAMFYLVGRCNISLRSSFVILRIAVILTILIIIALKRLRPKS